MRAQMYQCFVVLEDDSFTILRSTLTQETIVYFVCFFGQYTQCRAFVSQEQFPVDCIVRAGMALLPVVCSSHFLVLYLVHMNNKAPGRLAGVIFVVVSKRGFSQH